MVVYGIVGAVFLIVFTVSLRALRETEFENVSIPLAFAVSVLSVIGLTQVNTPQGRTTAVFVLYEVFSMALGLGILLLIIIAIAWVSEEPASKSRLARILRKARNRLSVKSSSINHGVTPRSRRERYNQSIYDSEEQS